MKDGPGQRQPRERCPSASDESGWRQTRRQGEPAEGLGHRGRHGQEQRWRSVPGLPRATRNSGSRRAEGGTHSRISSRSTSRDSRRGGRAPGRERCRCPEGRAAPAPEVPDAAAAPLRRRAASPRAAAIGDQSALSEWEPEGQLEGPQPIRERSESNFSSRGTSSGPPGLEPESPSSPFSPPRQRRSITTDSDAELREPTGRRRRRSPSGDPRLQPAVAYGDEQLRQLIGDFDISGMTLLEFGLVLRHVVQRSPGRLGTVSRLLEHRIIAENTPVGRGARREMPAELLPLPVAPEDHHALRISKALEAGLTLSEVHSAFKGCIREAGHAMSCLASWAGRPTAWA